MMKTRRSAARFLGDARGNFVVIGALVTVPLIVAMGGAIEFGLMYSNRTRIQDAADGAALAAAKQYAVNPDPAALAALADSFFQANAGKLFRSEATLVYDGMQWTADHARELKLHVDYSYDPMFLQLVPEVYAGIANRTSRIDSAVTVSDTTVEVAMVLDTSGSMAASPSYGGESKIVTLRKTARNAAAEFFAAQGTGNEEATRIAVVPFSGAVNVGAANLDAYWMDPKGLSPIHHENLDWTTLTDSGGNALATKAPSDNGWYLTADPSVRLTRQYVMKTMRAPTVVKDTTICSYKGVKYPGCSWVGKDTETRWMMKRPGGAPICRQKDDPTGCHPYRITYATRPLYELRGCVEARTGTFGINDATPDESKPETLFVPYMAVDEPDNLGGWNTFLRDENYEFPPKVFPLKGKSYLTKERDLNKYLLRPMVYNSPSTNNRYTPNFICDSAPLLPLSTDAAAVDSMIGNLQAVGATNVDEGVGWGWRVLSPTEPFAGSRAYTDTNNIKAMILMTDGENTSYTSGNENKSWFSSYGYAQISPDGIVKGGRIFDESGQSVIHSNSNYTRAMDGRTRKVCANAKADGKSVMTDVNGAPLSDERGPVQRDGIIIYTIAFDIPAASKARVDALLKDCASYRTEDLRATAKPYSQKAKNFYSVKDSAELAAAFSDITASLSKLRVSY